MTNLTNAERREMLEPELLAVNNMFIILAVGGTFLSYVSGSIEFIALLPGIILTLFVVISRFLRNIIFSILLLLFIILIFVINFFSNADILTFVFIGLLVVGGVYNVWKMNEYSKYK